MPQENVEIARQPLALKPRSRRGLAERLAMLLPRALALLTRAVTRLPTRSRLRRAVIHRAVQLGMEAINRGDYEAAFALHDPDVELNSPPDMIGLGEASVTRGREARIRFQRDWTAQWGEMRFEPEELIDFSDSRVLVVGRIKGSGLSSGAAFENEWANLLTLSGGRVVREQVFRDHGEALEAAGLEE
jgi:ketosteroid isomerase-like protein